jgi:hypothetical protein
MPAPATASSPRVQRGTSSRSARASAANTGRQPIAIWYGPASSQTAGCRLAGPGMASDRWNAVISAAQGSRMTAAPGSEMRPVGGA